MEHAKVGIIYLTYNSFEELKETIITSPVQNAVEFKYYVIDNNSPKTDKISMKEWCDKHDIVCILNNQNLGFAAGNNIAIEQAFNNNCTHVIVLNPDTIIHDNKFLKILLDEYGDHHGVLSALEILDDNTVYSAGTNILPIISMPLKRLRGINADTMADSLSDVDAVEGSCMFFDKYTWNSVGKIPESYFLYFEETDWCSKVARQNLPVRVTTKTKLVHNYSSSVGYISNVYLYYIIKNFPQFVISTQPWYYWPTSFLFYVLLWIPFHIYLCVKSLQFLKIKYILKGAFRLSF